MRNSKLKIILLTALLEVVSLGIIIPVLPFIVRSFGYGAEWVGISFSAASIGMFIGGMIFGRLSDKFGRKRMLSFTVVLNIIGYLIFANAWSIHIFILARIISGFATSGISVAQAYISDISSPNERTKNMGLIGAMFGIGFVLGPVFGSLFAGKSLQFLGYISASILVINAFIIWFFLPESKNFSKNENQDEPINPIDFIAHKKQLMVLFFASFGAALGFSGNQSILPLFLNEIHNIEEKHIGLVFAFIGTIIVIYQGFLIKYTRELFKEKGLVLFGILTLAISFIIFGFNRESLFLYPSLALFPIGFGSINPGINSLISKYAKKDTGKAMGTNVSFISIANILGPIIAGFSYKCSPVLPYLIGTFVLLITSVLVVTQIKK